MSNLHFTNGSDLGLLLLQTRLALGQWALNNRQFTANEHLSDFFFILLYCISVMVLEINIFTLVFSLFWPLM